MLLENVIPVKLAIINVERNLEREGCGIGPSLSSLVRSGASAQSEWVGREPARSSLFASISKSSFQLSSTLDIDFMNRQLLLRREKNKGKGAPGSLQSWALN